MNKEDLDIKKKILKNIVKTILYFLITKYLKVFYLIRKKIKWIY